MDQEILFPELSYSIVDCAFEVHNTLGGGLPEKVYQKALAIELTEKGIAYQEQYFSEILYKNKKIHRNFSDFLIEDEIILELKSSNRIIIGDYKQSKKYLLATGKKLAILLHFGREKLTFKRVLNLY